MRSLCLALALAIAGTAGPSRAAIYRWVDESGHTRFSDRIEDVPPAWRKNVEQQIQDDAEAAAVARPGKPAPHARPAPPPAAAPRAATPIAATPHATAQVAPPQMPPPEPASSFFGLPALGAVAAAGLVAATLVLRRRRAPEPAAPGRRP